MIYSILPNNILKDKSLCSLLLVNIITIIIALAQRWNLIDLMWIYWYQSIIIGLFTFLDIVTLQDYSTVGLVYTNGQQPKANTRTKLESGLFFLAHYGMFHYGYYTFLNNQSMAILYQTNFNAVSPGRYLIPVLLYLVNHLFSFIYNKTKNQGEINLGNLIFSPYARIIPMHLILIFGYVIYLLFPSMMLLVVFLLLKTFADIIMHMFKHNFLINPNHTIGQSHSDINPSNEI